MSIDPCVPRGDPAHKLAAARRATVTRMVVNMRGDIPLTVSINNRPCEAQTTYSWAAGGAVLTLSTVLPDRGLAAELISTYVGHVNTPTIVTHLMLGPVGHTATIRTEEHAHEHLDPVEGARECAYDHAHQLIELIGATGRQVNMQLDEQSFAALERIE
jgi:hypothetical protein